MSLDPSTSLRGAFGTLPVVAAVALCALAVALPSACLVLRDSDDEATAGAHPCVGCHGSAARPGPVEVQAAPPFDLAGNTQPAAPGVGAHEKHVGPSAIHAPIACLECHIVPTDSSSRGHADSPRPAEVTFGPLASKDGRLPLYDGVVSGCTDTYCHQQYVPTWTAPKAWSCGECHELPPPDPHDPSEQCSDCHGMVVDSGRGFIRRDLHVNGVVNEASPAVP